MHLRVDQHYDADVATVAAMLVDPDYTRARIEASGGAIKQADVTGTADAAFTVATRRSVPTDQIPAQARPLVGSTLEVRQVEAWEAPEAGTRRGSVVVEISGTPVRLTGTVTLQPDGPGASVLAYDGELKAAIPLFGAAVEQAAAGAVRSALAAEQAAGVRWLARG